MSFTHPNPIRTVLERNKGLSSAVRYRLPRCSLTRELNLRSSVPLLCIWVMAQQGLFIGLPYWEQLFNPQFCFIYLGWCFEFWTQLPLNLFFLYWISGLDLCQALITLQLMSLAIGEKDSLCLNLPPEFTCLQTMAGIQLAILLAGTVN